jgi:hypothetical protein
MMGTDAALSTWYDINQSSLSSPSQPQLPQTPRAGDDLAAILRLNRDERENDRRDVGEGTSLLPLLIVLPLRLQPPLHS